MPKALPSFPRNNPGPGSILSLLHPMRSLSRFLSLTTALAALTLTGANWTQFRGPLGSGVVEDSSVPTQLDAKAIAWSTALPGRGLSSPIIVGNRVFVTCSSGPKQDRLHVLCFDASKGDLLWERQFWATGRTMAHEKTSVAAPTPASDGERIFALFSSNDCVALDLQGNLLWYRGLGRDFPNASNSLGMSSSLVTAEGVLIAQVENDSESFTTGLDAQSGDSRWKMDRPKRANWTSPVLLNDPAKGTLVALQSTKGITTVEPKTGKILWEYTEGASSVPSSASAGGLLYVPSKGITVLQPGNTGEAPKQIWRSSQLNPGTSSPLVLGDKLFTLNDGGVLSCGEASTGKRLWQLRLKGPFSASPIAAGNHLYCVSEKGLTQVIDVSKPEGVVVSEFDLGATNVLGTPSIAHGGLFLRSENRLWKFARRTGAD